MIDLKLILKQHPNCLNSRATFKSVLMDTYPDEKRAVNILTIMFECGIVQKIKSKSILEDNNYQALLLQLENDYGIAPQYSSENILIWAKAFDVVVQVSSKPVTAPVAHEPIIHAPIVENVVVEGPTSDYKTKFENNAVTITKFIGFDEPEIIVPNCIDGVSVKKIGGDAFANCTGIERVIISEGIIEICNGAFSGCSSLKEVILPSSLQKLGGDDGGHFYGGVFGACPIEKFQLPSSLQYISGSAFSSCFHVQRIDLPNGIHTIPKECFWGCDKLKEVLLPDNLKTIEESAFADTGLTQIDIPASVKEIEEHAFRNCKNLTKVLLHEGLRVIGKGAFLDCNMLRTITIPKSVETIEDDLFTDRDLGKYIRYQGDTVISCYAGSAGLEYARKHGYQIKNAAKQ
jgi:hypothetical protein